MKKGAYIAAQNNKYAIIPYQPKVEGFIEIKVH